jgi:GNAT superfamily N-acetyltransferase
MSTVEHTSSPAVTDATIRRLRQSDLERADHVMRIAFGSFLGAPDPVQVFGDLDYVYSRFGAAPDWAFAAELDGELVGSVFVTRWGSFGFFGPLTVWPGLWDRGIGGLLLEPVMDLFKAWSVRQAALFTFPDSTKHVGLYQKFGFWPQHLTPVMQRATPAAGVPVGYSTYSQLPAAERVAALSGCGELTSAIYDGLDVSHEIRATCAHHLGDTVLLADDSGIAGLAVCHCRAGEAGSDACFIKFGAVRPGRDAGERFEQLVAACEDVARQHAAARIVAGVNAARHDAYRRLLGRGYRAWLQGVIMQMPNEPGYCRRDAYVIDDLR